MDKNKEIKKLLTNIDRAEFKLRYVNNLSLQARIDIRAEIHNMEQRLAELRTKHYLYINKRTMKVIKLPFYCMLLIKSKQGWSCYASDSDLQAIDNLYSDLIQQGYTPNEI